MSIINEDSDTYAGKVTEQIEETPNTEESVNEEVEQEEVVNEPPTSEAQSNESSLSTEQREKMLDELSYIEAMAEKDPSILEMDEYKSIKKALEASSEKPKVQVDSGNTEKEEEKEEEEEEDDSDLEDPFGVKKKKEKAVSLDFTFDEKAKSFLKEKYSIDDEGKFFNSVDTWRKQAQEVKEVKAKYDAIEADLDAMPSDLKTSINLWANGKEYRTVISNETPNVDFSKEFDDQDKSGITTHYHAKKIEKLQAKLDDGLIDEEDFEERLEEYHEDSQLLFKADKKRWENERAKYEREIEEGHRLFRSSVEGSVSNLKKNYPGFSDSNVQDIEKMMANGGVEDLFYNEDGTYTKEAAEFLALAKFGKSYIKRAVENAERDGETKANLDKVAKSKKKVTTGKTSRQISPNQAPEEVQHLNSVFKKDPYA